MGARPLHIADIATEGNIAMTDQTPDDVAPDVAPYAPPETHAVAPSRPPKPKQGGKGKGGKKKAARDHVERRENVKPPASIDVTYKGVTYSIDRARALDVESFELVEDGKYVTAVRSWLGADQWAAFKAAHRDPDSGTVPMEHLEGFLNRTLARTRTLGK